MNLVPCFLLKVFLVTVLIINFEESVAHFISVFKSDFIVEVLNPVYTVILV